MRRWGKAGVAKARGLGTKLRKMGRKLTARRQIRRANKSLRRQLKVWHEPRVFALSRRMRPKMISGSGTNTRPGSDLVRRKNPSVLRHPHSCLACPRAGARHALTCLTKGWISHADRPRQPQRQQHSSSSSGTAAARQLP